MNCPNCSRPMMALFYSTVCNHCNPPGTSTLARGPQKPTEWRGFICSVKSRANLTGRSFYVFKTRQEALDSRVAPGGDCHEVRSRNEIEYSTSEDLTIAYIVCEAELFNNKTYRMYKDEVALT